MEEGRMDFEHWFTDRYARMFHEIALGMLDYRESEEASLKVWGHEMFDPLSFNEYTHIYTNISPYNLRKILSESTPFQVYTAYHLGMVDEQYALQRAKDYGAMNIYDERNHPSTLLELGIIKSTYPHEIRENSGELSQTYHMNGFTLSEIIALTTVVPPDNPVRERIELTRHLM